MKYILPASNLFFGGYFTVLFFEWSKVYPYEDPRNVKILVLMFAVIMAIGNFSLFIHFIKSKKI